MGKLLGNYKKIIRKAFLLQVPRRAITNIYYYNFLSDHLISKFAKQSTILNMEIALCELMLFNNFEN
jgi:hypothetical protein